jgi:hypothetical protein
MAIKPFKRYATARGLAEALRDFLGTQQNGLSETLAQLKQCMLRYRELFSNPRVKSFWKGG